MTSIDKLRANLRKLSPNSGCLTREEAQFCNIFHSGEWNTAQKKEIFSHMDEEILDEFLEAKREFREKFKKND
jgi:hypothetical protein